MSTIQRAMKRMAAKSAADKTVKESSTTGHEAGVEDEEDRTASGEGSYRPPGDIASAASDGSSSYWGTLEFGGRIEIRPWASKYGMAIGTSENRLLVESYRHIKRPLIMNIEGDGRLTSQFANRIMVTSALPDEGKTFSALNLALTIAAERTKRVVFIDTDLVRSGLPESIRVESEVGLVDYLESDRCALEHVLQETDYGNLLIIPAGRSHPFSTELLASKRMRGLFKALEQLIADDVIIILDTPPLLTASDAATLARFVGQIVVVVETGQTNQHDLREALSMIDLGKVAGYILNKDDPLRRQKKTDYYRYSA